MILHKEGLESAPAENTDEGLSFAERLLKRRRVENGEVTSIDSRFLFPTSNVCERLFSKNLFTEILFLFYLFLFSTVQLYFLE